MGTFEEKLSIDIIHVVFPKFPLICVTLKFPLDSGYRRSSHSPLSRALAEDSSPKPTARSTQCLHREKKTT